MNRRSWSPERVITAIQDRQRRGLPLHRTWQDEPLLSSAAKYYFGSWQRALAAADLPSRPQRKWTLERVLAALRNRIAQGTSLDTVWTDDKGLYAAAVVFFGSWRNAKAAVGLRTAPNKRWSRQSVLDAIQHRHRKGMPLTALRREDPQLYSAATRYFGTWTEALFAAGLPPTRRVWKRESIVAAIQAHYARNASGKRRACNHTLKSIASRRFGSWAAALAAAHIEYTPHRKWSRRRVIEAIRQRFQEGPPRASVWHEDPGLAGAAAKYFGGWRNALQAAGIQPERRVWTAERVLGEVRRRYPRTTKSIWYADKNLAQAAKKFFGTYQRAVLAAGLEPRGKKWSRLGVIEAIQDRYVKRQPLTTGRTPQENSLFRGNTAFRLVAQALAAAGVPLPKPRKRWTPEQVLHEIRRRQRAGGGRIPVAAKNPRLSSAAVRHFGTWRKALQAIGIKLPRLPRTWDRQSLLAEIRVRQRGGLPVMWAQNKDLEFAARKLFGNWTALLLAAGLTPHRTRWNKERVIAEIHKRSQTGQSLSSSDPANYALVSAAANLFGSWCRARQAAENI